MAADNTGATGTDTVQHRADTDGIDLMQNESVLENRHPSWTLWTKALILGGLILLGGLGSGDGGGIVAGLFVGGGIFAYVVYARRRSRYIVTTERVKADVGLISSVTREYRIPDIQSLSTSQGIFEKLLGHGSVTLRTAANDEITWHGVPEYQNVTNTIREEQRAYDQA